MTGFEIGPGSTPHLPQHVARQDGEKIAAPPLPHDAVEISSRSSRTADPSRELARMALSRPRPGTHGAGRPTAALHATMLSKGPAPIPPADLLPVPDIRQSTSYSCGASALQGVLMYYGEEHLESELMNMASTDPEQGTNPRQMVAVARELGFEAEVRQNLTLDDLRSSLARKEPVIVAIQAWREGDSLQKPWTDLWDDGHYVVVIGMDDKRVWFEDPSLLGTRGYIDLQEFQDRWHDKDDIPYIQSGIFIRGKEPVAAPVSQHID